MERRIDAGPGTHSSKEHTMQNQLSAQDLQRAATRHVERKIGFTLHATIYLLVNIGLLGFNLMATPQVMWSFGPLFGWGIGLLFHGFAVFLRAPGASWKQRMIDHEMKKLRQSQQ
jgi:nitrate reductase gamma subunit